MGSDAQIDERNSAHCIESLIEDDMHSFKRIMTFLASHFTSEIGKYFLLVQKDTSLSLLLFIFSLFRAYPV